MINRALIEHCNFPLNGCYYILCVKVSFQNDVKRLVLIGTCMIYFIHTRVCIMSLQDMFIFLFIYFFQDLACSSALSLVKAWIKEN